MISQIIADMIDYNKHDTRRINHALKVHTYSKTIGELEKIDSIALQTLEITSILHDIGIKECERIYNACGGNLQQIEGPRVAKEILEKYTINKSINDRVLYLIAHHHTYKNINGLDHQILLEADLIVNAQEGNITIFAFRNAVKKLFVTKTAIKIAQQAVR